jgi:hypothetical protein
MTKKNVNKRQKDEIVNYTILITKLIVIILKYNIGNIIKNNNHNRNKTINNS